MCYDELVDCNAKNIGESLYDEHFFFCNTYDLICKDAQQRIKEYEFCKAFNTSPFQSLQDTPAQLVDEFIIIEKEISSLKKGKNG